MSGKMLKMSKNVKFALLCNRKNEKMADFCGFAGVFFVRRAVKSAQNGRGGLFFVGC